MCSLLSFACMLINDMNFIPGRSPISELHFSSSTTLFNNMQDKVQGGGQCVTLVVVAVRLELIVCRQLGYSVNTSIR